MMKAYPEYIESREKWIGDIPKDWIETRFKFLFSQKGKISNIDLPCGSISFGNVVYKDSEKLTEETRLAYQEVLNGEFLVNPLNLNYDLKSLRTALSDKDVIVSSGYIVLKSNEDTVPEYLKWLLFVFDIRHMKTLGAGIRQTITAKDIGDCYTYLPSLSEQKSIAQFLDFETTRIDNLISEKERFIKLLAEKRQALISHVVTKGLNPNVPMKDSGVEWIGEIPEHWVAKRLKHCLSIKNGQDYKLVETEDIDSSYPVYGSGGEFRRATDYLHDGESVLMGRKGTIDKPMYVNGKFWTVDTMFYSEINKNSDAKFLYYLATTLPFGYYQTKTALPSMTQGDLLNHPVAVPDKSEQIEIRKYIDTQLEKFDELNKETKKSIELLKEHRTALISAAVTGKIDVREEV